MDEHQEISRAAVLAALGRAPAEGIKVGDLGALLHIAKEDLYKLRKLLGELVDEGAVARIGGRFAAAPPESADKPVGTSVDLSLRRVPGDPLVIGRISVHPAGYGFVAAEDGSDDVFIPAMYRGPALDGDRVEVTTWSGYKGTEGQVVRIIERGRAKLTGTLKRVRRDIFLEPDDSRIAIDYGFIPLVDGAPSSGVGQAAVIEICRYPTESRRELVGRLVRVLGEPDNPRTEIEKILICADIPQEFAGESLAQAEATPTEVTAADFADRIDLRDRLFFTIDPEDARDFDDALCIEEGPGGTTRIWVAVADVAHYVRVDGSIDQDAQMRGFSVYLPDRVVPMLPFPLSAGICSLKPETDRCAMVVRLDFAKDGTLRDTGIAAAIIRSRARLDYPGVAAALSGDFRGTRMRYQRWADALTRLASLAQVLRKRRLDRGALDLDIPEPKVLLDDDNPELVRDVVRSKASDDVKHAYQLVEEFMIAANEAVGSFFAERGLTTVWRCHAPPEVDRLEELAQLLAAYGIDLDVDRAKTPRGLKDTLQELEGRPEASSLSFLLLRSLKQAVYDTRPIGHFGLASASYLHFTSPIRRYPDLLVHRLLKAQLHREGQASGGGAAIRVPSDEALQELATATSRHERRAMEAEREAVAMYRAYIMRDQIGEQFVGRVSAVTGFGVFVELDRPFVEGLIKVENLGADTFDHDEQRMRLRGRLSGLTISLGDTVTVMISNVSVASRRIDMHLIRVGVGD